MQQFTSEINYPILDNIEVSFFYGRRAIHQYDNIYELKAGWKIYDEELAYWMCELKL